VNLSPFGGLFTLARENDLPDSILNRFRLPHSESFLFGANKPQIRKYRIIIIAPGKKIPATQKTV